MNKVILMGRLTKDPETRYSQSAEPLAVTRFSLAINRRFKREGEQDADFINCVAFGKQGEFVEKYFKKGQMLAVTGRLQVRQWTDQQNQKHWSTEVVVEEAHFTESKASASSRPQEEYQPKPDSPISSNDGFYPISEGVDDEELPF